MINILFSGNKGVFDGVLSCMLSIFKRTQTKEPFHIYIFTMNVTRLNEAYCAIDENQISFLDTVAKKYNQKNIVEQVDVTDLYEQEFGYCPNEGAYCSPYTLLRLFSDMVCSIPDKILYLDVDILFNRDIMLLYNTNITDYEYAAARDHYGKYLINPNYINAGVFVVKYGQNQADRITSKSKTSYQNEKACIR